MSKVKPFHHLQGALGGIGSLRRMTAHRLMKMNDESVKDLYQLILRFTKLQDTMGTQLFPAALDVLQEPFEYRPMIDKLHRLEKLGYLGVVEQWHALRLIRNRSPMTTQKTTS